MELKVLKGGKSEDLKKEYIFLKGSITDTRLMGVLGLHMHFRKKVEGFEPVNLHLFLYYDIEEIGFDSIRAFEIDDPIAVRLAEKAAFGGLGAKMVYLSERECRTFVKQFVEDTKKRHLPLPNNLYEIQFLIDDFDKEEYMLSDEEYRALQLKASTEIHSDFGYINYYLMRCLGKDFDGAKLLLDEDYNKDLCEDISYKGYATFLKNSIELFIDQKGNESYLCQSLVELEDSYHLLQSEFRIGDNKVIYAKKLSDMQISVQEASLMLTKEELVASYEILCNMDDFDIDFAGFSVGFTKNEHFFGNMFMEYRKDNLHVENREYNLSDDVKALYFVTDYGQLIVGAYSFSDLAQVTLELENMLSKEIVCTGHYQFPQSVIYEFALSDYTDFEDFIDSFENN